MVNIQPSVRVNTSVAYVKKQNVRNLLMNLIRDQIDKQNITNQDTLNEFLNDMEWSISALKEESFETLVKPVSR